MTFKLSEVKTSVLVPACVVLTVIVLILTGAAIKNLVSDLTLNNKILSRKRAVQQTLASNLEALNSLKTEFEALGPDRDRITRALPSEPDFPALVAMLENLSINAGVNINSISPGNPSESPSGPSSYSFTVSMSANYETFKQFLKNVETSLRPLAITGYTATSSQGALAVELQMVTYYQPPFDTTIKTEPLDGSAAATTTSNPTNNNTPSSVNPLAPSQGVNAQ